jgi:hypothetical protein
MEHPLLLIQISIQYNLQKSKLLKTIEKLCHLCLLH